jgi:hypothetical protein
VRLRRDKVVHVADFLCKHVEVGDLLAQCCNNHCNSRDPLRKSVRRIYRLLHQCA